MKGLTLTQKEQERLQVLNSILERRVSIGAASALLGLSERHTWRILAAYRKEGPATLAHGNRGRKAGNATPEEVKEQVRELAKGIYERVNHSHLTELLGEREAITLSRSTVRRILVAAGLRSPRRRRPPKHRSRRERYPQEGMLLQVDGSHHDWLEGRGPAITLTGAIDDATGEVPYALFREQEDAQGYLLLLRKIIHDKGIPLAIYSDRHGVFQRSPKEAESLEEQLAGERQPTQMGRALAELGITNILALSPQAKGRIERLWGTLQDRLVTELRLARASSLEGANKVLAEFLPRYNARFAVPATQPGSAYRQPEPGLCLEGILCFKYQRTVAPDNTVPFFGRTIQLLPGQGRLSYARARVEVQERLDGSLVVTYQGQTIGSQQAPPGPVTLRARKNNRATSQPSGPLLTAGTSSRSANAAARHSNRSHQIPGPDHPWRKSSLTKSLNT